MVAALERVAAVDETARVGRVEAAHDAAVVVLQHAQLLERRADRVVQ